VSHQFAIINAYLPDCHALESADICFVA